MKITIDTRFSVGDVVRVVSAAQWQGTVFKIISVEVTWSSREDSVYRENGRKGLIKYAGLVARDTAWGFYEDQLEAVDVDLSGFTWDVKDGYVVELDGAEWTITDIATRWTGGGQAYMGGPIDPGTPHTWLTLVNGDKTIKHELLDSKPIKVVGHKQKTFV